MDDKETGIIIEADGELIKSDGVVINYNDLFNLSVVESLENEANTYFFESPFVNELYRDYFIPYICIRDYLKDKRIDRINANNAKGKLKAVLLDYAQNNNIKFSGGCSYFISNIKYGLFGVITFLYLGIKQFGIKKHVLIDKTNEVISICRTPAAYKKIQKILDENVLFESAPGKGNVYEQLSFFRRLRCLFATIGQQHREIRVIKKWLMSKNYNNILCDALDHYKDRIIHTFFYENVIDEILKDGSFKRFITGNNLDRFAIIEEKIAIQKGLKLVCVPHGIEYGYKFPKCFVGDCFYTTSEYAEKWLNKLYGTNKFIYDHELMHRVFSVQSKGAPNRNIVFFSEPRESDVSVKIICDICEELTKHNLKLCLKLHPKDKQDDYEKAIEKYDITLISDLNEAISGNICIARKSTTIIEALHNESIAYAIVTNEKDKSIYKTFPSLQDEKIKYYEDVDKMIEDIIQFVQ